MKIKLTCCCGATFEAETSTYVNRGGAPDSAGRKFVVQVQADNWLNRHNNCRPAPTYMLPAEPRPSWPTPTIPTHPEPPYKVTC